MPTRTSTAARTTILPATSIGFARIDATQHRVELIEAQIATITARLDGSIDALSGSIVAPASGGLRDQLLSNLDDELAARDYWSGLLGEQLAAAIVAA